MNKNQKVNNKPNKTKWFESIISFFILALIIIFTIKVSNKNKINFEESNLIDSIPQNNVTETFAVNNNSNQNNNSYLILVNKNNRLTEDYKPEDLEIPHVRLRTADDMCEYVRTDVAVALEKMFNDAEKDGIYLIGISGYRSYDYQETVYANNIINEGQDATSKYVALPGSSEHQTGLVMDVLSDEYSSLDEGFENTNAFKWLSKNMSKYGFILRYPKGKEDITGYGYEPWHLRYVGVDAAKEILEKGLTLEEYLNN